MSHKICPICGTPAHEQAIECGVCGAGLTRVEAIDERDEERPQDAAPGYDFHFGETDLAEHQLRWKGGTYILVGMLALAALMCTGAIILGVGQLLTVAGRLSPLTPSAMSPTAVPVIFATNSPQPTLFLPTVTADAPPTRTITPSPAPTDTPGPCFQEVQPGDSLIGLIARCGHNDLDVIDLVLEVNGLDAPEFIQSGQTLEIPWPTPTADPNAQPTEESQAAAPADTGPLIAFVPDDNARAAFVVPTETLQPGVTWHTVVLGENIISIGFEYGANVKVLSELNPEVTFSQCDFGQFGGGPSCVVNLFEGQRLRVPAPTPTPTLSPTPSGSETPTPTATPTFNAPSLISPGDRALFRSQDLVTLRWVASGTLAPGQVYRVRVEDTTVDMTYAADTTELFLIMPEDWQGRDGQRHEFHWSVSVIDAQEPENVYFATETRIFTWESQG